MNSDGTKYTGSWEKDCKSGAGQFHQVNGDVIHSTWLNDSL